MEHCITKLHTTKEDLRKLLKARMGALDSKRKAEARESLCEQLVALLSPFALLLSFQSFKDEIATDLLHGEILEKLCFPRMVGDELWIYQGSKRICPESIPLALVPGLGFDASYHRLGRGKGYYDRFLSRFPHIQRWGIGYKEQLVATIAVDAHDCVMDALYLF
jgi:5-formyltetrahydrofolate cyclo-ligase